MVVPQWCLRCWISSCWCEWKTENRHRLILQVQYSMFSIIHNIFNSRTGSHKLWSCSVFPVFYGSQYALLTFSQISASPMTHIPYLNLSSSHRDGSMLPYWDGNRWRTVCHALSILLPPDPQFGERSEIKLFTWNAMSDVAIMPFTKSIQMYDVSLPIRKSSFSERSVRFHTGYPSIHQMLYPCSSCTWGRPCPWFSGQVLG